MLLPCEGGGVCRLSRGVDIASLLLRLSLGELLLSRARLRFAGFHATQHDSPVQKKKGTPMLAKRRKQPYLAITTIGIAVALLSGRVAQKAELYLRTRLGLMAYRQAPRST